MPETAPATTPSPVAPPPPAVAPVSPSPAPAVAAPPVHIRGLFINILFAMFAATVIFAIASYFFLVPRIAIQELRVVKLEHEVHSLRVQVRDLPAAPKAPAAVEPAAPAPAAAPAAPAAAPAAPPAPAPAK